MVLPRKSRKAKVQIDTDWLLGSSAHARPAVVPIPTTPSASPNRNLRFGRIRRFLSLVVLCGVTAAVAGNWETASHQVLRWQWKRLLSIEETSDETLAALVSLSESIGDADILLVEQLRSQEGTRRTIAFQLLKERLERPNASHPSSTQRQSMLETLESMDPSDSELMMMRGLVASRLLARLSPDDPKVRSERETLMAMIDRAAPPIPTSIASSRPATDANLLTNSTGMAERVASSLPTPRPPTVTAPDLPPFPGSPTGTGNASIAKEDLIATGSVVTAPVVSVSTVNGAPSAWAPNSLRDVPSAFDSIGAQRLSDDANRLDAPQRVPVTSTGFISGATTESTAPIESTVGMRGFTKLSTEQVLRLLESSQDRLVVHAVSELESRGFKTEHVELAMELARGTSAERLRAMDSLTRDPELNPVPWLVWMAESGDREARLRAVSMLGATADQEALRKLRLLKQREVDQRVADQITQVLLAAGSVRSTNR